MLDKLGYFKEHAGKPSADTAEGSNDIIEALKNYFYMQTGCEVNLKSAAQGTLGITFLCYGLPEGPRFIKTHLPGNKRYQECLEREYHLLSAANGNTLNIKINRFLVKNEEQICLQMDILNAMEEVTPASVCNIIERYQERLANFPIRGMYDLEDIWHAAWDEMEILYDHHFFTDETYIRAKRELTFLGNELSKIRRCICHGDLSDRNMMVNKEKFPVVIDWEDAFQGCAEYDYLYWLTFFNHRKFYKRENFLKMGIEQRRAQAIITMIVLVKCGISFYSGSYRQNSLTMEDRLREVWNALGGQ